MKLKPHYFARLREVFGLRAEQFNTPEDAVADLLDHLRERGDESGGRRSGSVLSDQMKWSSSRR